MAQEIYELGRIPDLCVVPQKMYAQLIRGERFGEPKTAFQLEQVPVPEVGPRDVLGYLSCGVNTTTLGSLCTRSTDPGAA